MDDFESNNLKQFFSRAYITDHFGKVAIGFQEIGIKFHEKDAVLTDLTAYNHLSIGDWCVVGGRYFREANYRPKEGVTWKEANDKIRVIIAFFEIEGKVIKSGGGGKVKRIFCATGVPWTDEWKALRDRHRWPPKPRTEYIDGIEIRLDVIACGNRNCPVKLFEVNMLIKREKPQAK